MNEPLWSTTIRHILGLILRKGFASEVSILLRWAYPQVAEWCGRQGRPYPALSAEGEIAEDLPRTLKLRY